MTDPLMTDADMATRLGKSRWFVQERCRGEQAWPHLRVGQSIRFLPEHVEAIDALLATGPTVKRPENPWGHRGRSA